MVVAVAVEVVTIVVLIHGLTPPVSTVSVCVFKQPFESSTFRVYDPGHTSIKEAVLACVFQCIIYGGKPPVIIAFSEPLHAPCADDTVLKEIARVLFAHAEVSLLNTPKF